MRSRVRASLELTIVAGLLVGVAASAQPPEAVHHIHGLAFDRRDPDVLLIATHTGLVRVTSNAKLEWIGQHRFDLMGFTAHPTDPDLVYASGHPDVQTYVREKVGNLGLLASRDGGRTWQTVALRGEADFHALTLSPRDGGVLYGWNVAGEPGLYRISTRTWAVERLPARGLAKVLALSASPDAAGPLLAGTMTGLLASRDGGNSWQRVGGITDSASVTAVTHHPSEPRTIYAYVHQAGSGLLVSRDGGETWQGTTFTAKPDGAVVALAVAPAERVALATAHGDVVRSSDGGLTWDAVLRHGRPEAAR